MLDQTVTRLLRQVWCRISVFFFHKSIVSSARKICSSLRSIISENVQNPSNCQLLKSLLNFDVGPASASQTKKLRKRFCWVEPAPLWASSYTNLLYKVQGPFSAHADSPSSKKNFLILNNFDVDQSLLHKPRNSGGDFVAWNQLPCGPALTPTSCTKFKIHLAHADSPNFKTFFFLILRNIFDVGPVFAITDPETQEEILLSGASSLVGQLLHPSLEQNPRSIQRMQTIQILKQVSTLTHFDLGHFASQVNEREFGRPKINKQIHVFVTFWLVNQILKILSNCAHRNSGMIFT